MNEQVSQGTKRGGNIFILLILRLGLLFLLYFLCRLLFFAYNYSLLDIHSLERFFTILWGGFIFDASAICLTNSLFILCHLLPIKKRLTEGYQSFLKWLYFLINVPFLMMNLGDIIYFRFTGKRTTSLVFQEFKNENIFDFLGYFLDYWHLTLLGLGLIALCFYLYPRRDLFHFPLYRLKNKFYYPLSLVSILLAVGISIIAIRGGISSVIRPISPADALIYTDNAQQSSMVLNTPFTILRLIGVDNVLDVHYMTKAELQQIFSPERGIQEEKTPYTAQFKGRNVVFIIWESCAKEWVGGLNKGRENFQSYTPFLDRLIEESYTFEYSFANGTKSVDAMPAIFASVPKPIESFCFTHYGTNKLNTILSFLKKEGYRSAYFHNAPKGSMGFDAMSRHLGFEEYHGMEDFQKLYGTDSKYFDGCWGIWDEPFLQYMITELNKLSEPFVACEFTTSSHIPFDLPKDYAERFPAIAKNTDFHKVIPYTDFSLERFFAEAKNQKWYANTLFIICADHTTAACREDYKNSMGAYSIPIIFYDPNGVLKGYDSSTVVQQADILPSLMDLLGIQAPIVSFGHNVFNPKEEHYAINTLGQAFQIIKGDYVLQFGLDKVISLYNYKEDPQLKRNLKGKGLAEEEELKRYIQAVLQELSERLKENKLSNDN